MTGEQRATRGGMWVARWLVTIAVIAAMAMVAVPRLAQGFITWTGIDPIVQVGAHQLSIQVEWPSGSTSAIQGPIAVQVEVPEGVSAALVGESAGVVDGVAVSTVTTIDTSDGGKSNVKVEVTVNASSQFPVRVALSWDGTLARTLHGSSNHEVSGKVAIP